MYPLGPLIELIPTRLGVPPAFSSNALKQEHLSRDCKAPCKVLTVGAEHDEDYEYEAVEYEGVDEEE